MSENTQTGGSVHAGDPAAAAPATQAEIEKLLKSLPEADKKALEEIKKLPEEQREVALLAFITAKAEAAKVAIPEVKKPAAQTATTPISKEDEKVIEDAAAADKGLPTWGWILIAVGAAGIGALAAYLITSWSSTND